MAHLGEAIYSILSNDPTLTGWGVDISPMMSDVTAKVPLVTYEITDDFLYTKAQSDAVRSKLEFMVVSDRYLEMNDITTQVVLLLDKFSDTEAGVVIRSIDVEDASEQRDKTNDLYLKTVDFVAIWNK